MATRKPTPAPLAADASKGPLPVYVIFGADSFLRLEALQRILREVLGDEPDAMALAEYEGPSTTITTVLDELRTPSLLAPRRVVLVRDADDLLKSDPEAKITNRELMEKYLGAPTPTGILILVCRSWAKTTRLYKLVDKIGRNFACDPPKPQEIPTWLVARARSTYGVSLDSAASRRLAELVGSRLGILDMELAKLATFVAPRTAIAQSDVEQMVGATREEVIFRITDAVTRGDAPAALAIWDQVLATDRSAPYRAVGGLAYAFRRLAEAKNLVEQGVPAMEAARRLRIWGDYGLERQLARFPLAQWYDHLLKLLKIDLDAKTGLGDVQTNVEKLVIGLSRPTRPAARA
ncbi:DNA polymerase III subunit delta [Phycisphaerae bacterium RAS2]|nr:DNA polymerase III subunit delta [Phycisphaerae bacterium RAS2]